MTKTIQKREKTKAEKAKFAAYMKERNKKLKKAAVKQAGGGCFCCGESRLEMLALEKATHRAYCMNCLTYKQRHGRCPVKRSSK